MGEVRAGGAIHTGGNWSVGKTSCVVSDVPHDLAAPGIGGSDDVAYYGGHMICESISQSNQPIVSAAPDMFDALLAVKQRLNFMGMFNEPMWEGRPDWRKQIKLIESALLKAVTRVELPEPPVDLDPDGVGIGYREVQGHELMLHGDTWKRPGEDMDWVITFGETGKPKDSTSLKNCVVRRKVVAEPIDASFAVKQKPPIGVMPRHLWLESRRDDLYGAIDRYREHGVSVHIEWLDELRELEYEIQGE